jgi:hypothetical protein
MLYFSITGLVVIHKSVTFKTGKNARLQWLRLGGRDQEVHGSKSTWANSSQNPISKKPITKKMAGGVTQGGGPEFKPCSTAKKRNWGKKSINTHPK